MDDCGAVHAHSLVSHFLNRKDIRSDNIAVCAATSKLRRYLNHWSNSGRMNLGSQAASEIIRLGSKIATGIKLAVIFNSAGYDGGYILKLSTGFVD